MTKEQRDIIAKDLSARIPYGVCVEIDNEFIDDGRITIRMCEANASVVFRDIEYLNVKPYLRPLSSMTDKEKELLNGLTNPVDVVDFYLSRFFDFRGLIDADLAIDTTGSNDPYYSFISLKEN